MRWSSVLEMDDDVEPVLQGADSLEILAANTIIKEDIRSLYPIGHRSGRCWADIQNIAWDASMPQRVVIGICAGCCCLEDSG